MIEYRQDDPLTIGGQIITPISRIQINTFQQRGALIVSASKTPAAILITDGETKKLIVLDENYPGTE